MHGHIRVLSACLGAAAVWPIFGVSSWFGVNIGTLEQLALADPGGFRPVPAVLLFVRPLLAAAASLVAPLAAVRIFTSPPPSAPGILKRAMFVELGLIVAFVAARVPVHAALVDWLPMAADRRTPGAYVAPGHFIALQEHASGAVLTPLVCVACGLATLWWLALRTPSR